MPDIYDFGQDMDYDDFGRAKIKVVGVGGGGNNAVNTMIAGGLEGVEFIAINTDAQDLNKSLAPRCFQLGAQLTRGLGAGADPEMGREAALEDRDRLSELLMGSDMVFITAGMGGGTGTGAAPVIAEVARELGALTVAVVTRPFHFEGRRRRHQAETGITNLKSVVDTLITIPNQRLLGMANPQTTLMDALGIADKVLFQAIQGVSDLINREGLINVDFADLRTIMANKGVAIMGVGRATGDHKIVDAAQEAISSPLLDDVSISGADSILMNITGPTSMGLFEVNEAASLIEEEADEDVNFIWGVIYDESLKDEVRVTVIGTGFQELSAQSQALNSRPTRQVRTSARRPQRDPPVSAGQRRGMSSSRRMKVVPMQEEWDQPSYSPHDDGFEDELMSFSKPPWSSR